MNTGTIICSSSATGDWSTEEQLEEDWAIIILKGNFDNSVGTYDFYAQTMPYSNKSVKVNGYDGDNPIPYTVDGTVSYSIFKSKILDSTNIYVEKGMSGGPCLLNDNGSYKVIGITSYFLSGENPKYHTNTIFRRIDKTLYNTLKYYIEQYGSK